MAYAIWKCIWRLSIAFLQIIALCFKKEEMHIEVMMICLAYSKHAGASFLNGYVSKAEL